MILECVQLRATLAVRFGHNLDPVGGRIIVDGDLDTFDDLSRDAARRNHLHANDMAEIEIAEGVAGQQNAT